MKEQKWGGAFKSVWKVKSVSVGGKRAMYERIVVPTICMDQSVGQ